MILDTKSSITVEGALSGTSVPMQLDPAGFAHIMEMLANQYSDDIYAFVREYSTNAWDAHVEAGVTNRAIEVTLPSELAPHFKVKDYGLGLSEQDVIDVYSKFGASTKRESNDLNGALGIGCKSGLAYTNQFTVTAVKDGQSVTIVVGKDDDLGGVMHLVNKFETDAPNSVEVSIPVDESDLEEVAETAYGFYRVWKLGTVKVNGEYPEPIDGLRLNDRMMIVQDEPNHLVVMGNVPYPVYFTIPGLQHNEKVVYFANIGDAVMANSREELRKNNPKNQALIARIQEEFAVASRNAVQEAIKNAPDKTEAMALLIRWQHIVKDNAKLYYKGKVMPYEYYRKAPETKLDKDQKPIEQPDNRFLITNSGSSKLSQHEFRRKIAVGSWEKAVFVTDWDRPTFTATQKKKLNMWSEQNIGVDKYGDPIPEYYVLFREGSVPTEIADWTDKSRHVSWTEVNELKLPRTGGRTASGRKSGSFQAYEAGSWVDELMPEDIDTKSPIFYVDSDNVAYNWKSTIESFEPNATIVIVAKNRVPKFTREFPQAQEPRPWLTKLYKAWARKLTPRQKVGMEIHNSYYDKQTYSRLDSTKVEDPALKRWISAAGMNIEPIIKEQKKFTKVSGAVSITAEPNPLDTNYPLWDNNVFGVKENREHCYTYLNSAYRARKETK